MKQEDIEKIKKEIINNWNIRNSFLGVRRFRLESFSSEKKWKVRKVIALMRKEKLIFLYKRNYFIKMEKLK